MKNGSISTALFLFHPSIFTTLLMMYFKVCFNKETLILICICVLVRGNVLHLYNVELIVCVLVRGNGLHLYNVELNVCAGKGK